jgi:hypothetical protein
VKIEDAHCQALPHEWRTHVLAGVPHELFPAKGADCSDGLPDELARSSSGLKSATPGFGPSALIGPPAGAARPPGTRR